MYLGVGSWSLKEKKEKACWENEKKKPSPSQTGTEWLTLAWSRLEGLQRVEIRVRPVAFAIYTAWSTKVGPKTGFQSPVCDVKAKAERDKQAAASSQQPATSSEAQLLPASQLGDSLELPAYLHPLHNLSQILRLLSYAFTFHALD